MATKVLGDGHCLVCGSMTEFKESKAGFATYFCYGCMCQYQGRRAGVFDSKVRSAVIKKETTVSMEDIPEELVNSGSEDKKSVFGGWLSDE